MSESIEEMKDLYIPPEVRKFCDRLAKYLITGFTFIATTLQVVVLFVIGLCVQLFICDLGRSIFNLWDYLMDKCERKRVIMDRVGQEPYLIRYYLLFTHRIHFPFNIFIHKFLKGDDDEIHDHPWGYFTLILWGGYYETIMNVDGSNKIFWREPGFFQSVTHKHRHMIQLNEDKTCWTLFIPFKKVNTWGFWKKRTPASSPKWIDSDIYLKSKMKHFK